MTGLYWLLVHLVLPALLAALLSGGVILLGIHDAPDGERKLQARPVPSAGGIAILLSAAIMLFAGGFLTLPQLAWPGTGLGALLAFVVAAAGIGLYDDLFGMSSQVKLTLLAAASLVAAIWGPRLGHFHVPFGPDGGVALPVWVSVAGVTLWLFVMANATNFMDGSNGMAMGSAGVMLVFYAILLSWLGAGNPAGIEGAMSLVAGFTAAAILGFLAWNMTGRLYAGDTGSLSMGGLLGAAGLIVACRISVWEPVILMLPFLVDVFMTLLWRAGLRRDLFQPHRDHAYQLFLRAGWSHARVAALWWGLSLLCGLGLVGLGPLTGSWILMVLLGLGIVLWCWQRVTLGRRLAREGR